MSALAPRLRAYRAAAALIYFGAILSGISTGDFSGLPAMALIFVLHRVAANPPRMAEAGTAAWVTQALVSGLFQIALAAIAIAVGQLIARFSGATMPMSALIPAGIALVGVIAGRLIWRRVEETGSAVADTLAQRRDDDD